MPDRDDYLLVDAGDGRRLERFGERVVDRPAPTAGDRPRIPKAWTGADLRYEPGSGWTGERQDPWTLRFHGLTLELRPTETGQVGLFPEHAASWAWLDERLRERPGASVLHLFAYTGATTLVMARAGASVAHVDAARSAVAWARRNAERSGLDRAPIRWLIEDAARFVEREARRGRRYQGLVLDPPAWGHAVGRRWRLDDDLSALLDGCARLLDRQAFVLLTAHSVGWDPDRLADVVSGSVPLVELGAGELTLQAHSGATLQLGAYARGIIDR